MAEARETFVDSQGLSIHCLEWGKPAGEPLVLIHGYLDLAHSWRAFVAALEKKHGDTPWIIAPDCRGRPSEFLVAHHLPRAWSATTFASL